MREKKQLEDEAQEGGGRFLTRHSSTSILDFFGCCSSTATDFNERLPNLERNPSQKISIKNVMKKSMVYGTPSQAAFDSPNRFESMKKEHETRTITNRKYSNYTQLSGSLIKNQSQKTIPNNRAQRVNFMYNNEQSQTGVRNYHTTNVIFEKYIVKPQQMNVFVNQHNQNVNYSHKNYDFAQHEDFREQQIDNQQSPKWTYGSHQFLPPQNNTYAKIDNNNCHYSFGQHQKKFLMSKFSGFRQVISNRPSKQSIREHQSGYQSPKNQQQARPYSFLKKQRGNLNSLVRDIQVMDEESDDSKSGKSQVIDSYQNMMSRIHQKSGVFPPNSYRQNF